MLYITLRSALRNPAIEITVEGPPLCEVLLKKLTIYIDLDRLYAYTNHFLRCTGLVLVGRFLINYNYSDTLLKGDIPHEEISSTINTLLVTK